MDKIERGNPLTQSADIVKENLETLKRLFPTIVKEGKIDVDELKALIDDEVETSEEYYRFTWAGKSEARREANKPSTGTLRPNKADSKNWDTTGNIFIEGDNLEVLKLMQKSYAGKIKMIYFDPPYNTGKDFVYKDNYKDNLGNYLAISKQTDDEGNKLNTNTESDGRYHSNWLNMMYPRLKLAYNLLSDDAVIFASIDDKEVFNLRKLMDEILGESNFVAIIIWEQGKKALASQVAINHEYCLIYCKNKTKNIIDNRLIEETFDYTFWANEKIGADKILDNFTLWKTESTDIDFLQEKLRSFYSELNDDDPTLNHTHYKFVDENGIYFAGDISQGTGTGGKFDIFHPISNMPVIKPSGGWRFSEKKLPELIKNDRIHFGPDHTTIPCLKRYLHETKYETANSVFYKDGRGGSKRLANLMGGKYFDFPKDEEIISKFIKWVSSGKKSNEIILDFFAGSGTTAHSVMKLNKEEGSDRKFILIQLPEPVAENSDAYKAGYKNIAELCKERLRRAGEKIKSELTPDLFSDDKNKLDIGFKAFKLDSSNIHSWDGSVENFEANLFNAQNNIKDDRTEEDVLFEILLKYGLDLTVPIHEKTVGKCKVYSIGAGVLFICLSDNITTEVAIAIGEWKKELEPATCRVLFKDNGFIDDVAKTNSVQILRQYGIEECNSI